MRFINYLRKSVFPDSSQKRSGSIFYGNKSIHDVTPDNALELADILTCVRVLAESVACLPLCLYKQTPNGGEKDYNHNLFELVRWQPNANMTSYDLRLWMMVDALLRGNGCCQVIRDMTGIVIELYPLFAS